MELKRINNMLLDGPDKHKSRRQGDFYMLCTCVCISRAPTASSSSSSCVQYLTHGRWGSFKPLQAGHTHWQSTTKHEKERKKKKSPPAKSKEADASRNRRPRSRSNNQQPNDIIILQVEFISVLLLPLLKEMPFSLSFFIYREKVFYFFI
jgi:hypothetical protein